MNKLFAHLLNPAKKVPYFAVYYSIACWLVFVGISIKYHIDKDEIITGSRTAMILMTNKYVKDTKDMPVTIRCKKIAKACNYSYLRTGR